MTIEKIDSWAQTHGYVETDMPDVHGFLPDGRRVVAVDGRRFVMTMEAHNSAVQAALAAKVEVEKAKRAMQPKEVRETIAATTCPQMHQGKPCGGALNRKGVCPSCVTGKMGYRYRYTCEACGFDIVTKTELAE